MKKVYAIDFNNVLLDVKKEVELVEDARDADVLLLWQDVRGDTLDLLKINEDFMNKPVVVVQHGRGATRDYLPPNKFPMKATKFCCWGQKEYDNLKKAGYGDRAVITGSPLIKKLKKKEKHDGKNITFVPIITQHEEPINIRTFFKLKQLELKNAEKVVEKHEENLRHQWHSYIVDPSCVTEKVIPYHVLNKDWRLISKIVGSHDKKLYIGDVVATLPKNLTHIDDSIKLLKMVDCVVGIEEGTFQLLAMAMDVPVVMVDGFKYREYGGVDYSSIEMIRTDGVTYTDLSNIEETINNELANPERLREKRRQVVEDELGDLESDPIQNIVKVIQEV